MRDLTTSLFNVPARAARVGQGSLLIADPFIEEAYFNHSVVSIVDYDENDGALGLVMNNKTGHTLDCYLDGVSADSNVPVYCGGPLGPDRMVFMHTLGEEVFAGAKQFAPGLWLGGNFDAAIDYVNSGYPLDGLLRFFIGYSGWTAPQLKNELRESSWAVADFPSDKTMLLSLSDDAYWHRYVRMLGEHYRAWQLMPREPRAN